MQVRDTADVAAAVALGEPLRRAARGPLGRPQLRRLLDDRRRRGARPVAPPGHPRVERPGHGRPGRAADRRPARAHPARPDRPVRLLPVGRHRAGWRSAAGTASPGRALRAHERQPAGRARSSPPTAASAHVDADTNEDLYWACRGGGGGQLRRRHLAHAEGRTGPPAPSYFFVSWPWSQAGEAMAAWQRFAPARAARAHLDPARSARRAAPARRAWPRSGQYFGREAALRRLIGPLTRVAGASLSTGSSELLLDGAALGRLPRRRADRRATGPRRSQLLREVRLLRQAGSARADGRA